MSMGADNHRVEGAEHLSSGETFLGMHCWESPTAPGTAEQERWFAFKLRKMAAGTEGHETVDSAHVRRQWAAHQQNGTAWSWAKLMAREADRKDLEELHHLGGIPVSALAAARAQTSAGRAANSGNAWLNHMAREGGDPETEVLNTIIVGSPDEAPGQNGTEGGYKVGLAPASEKSVQMGRVLFTGKSEYFQEEHRPKRKRDHHVPCWLTEAFTNDGTRSGRLVMFIEGKDPICGTPEGWGAEKGFYRQGGTDIDPGWNSWEGQDAKCARELRTDGRAENTNHIPGMLTRLAARTRSARDRLEAAAESVGKAIIDKVEENPRHGAELKRRMIVRLKTGDPGFRERARKTLIAKGVERPSVWRVDREMRKLAKKAERVPEEEFARATAQAVEVESARIPGRARNAHLHLLHTEIQQGKVLGKYARKGMGYGTFKVNPALLCIGDCPVLEDRRGGEDRAYHPYEAEELDMAAVYLPLAPDVLLVGWWDPEYKVRDVEWILRGVAYLSHLGFVARESGYWTALMHARIGMAYRGLSDDEAVQVLSHTRWGKAEPASGR